jgi:regulator of cell morphogenesis and NO signaling
MTTATNQTVRELAVHVPGAARIFETVGIDYCCGGNRSLRDACEAAGVDVETIVASLRSLEAHHTETGFAPATATLAALMDHIVDTHHEFTRSELARLDKLVAKVVAAHGERHPELVSLQELFDAMRDDLLPHMMKEEQILFPYIRSLERAVSANRSAPIPPFGTVRNPVRMMTMEHEAVGELLVRARELTGGYAPPADACVSYRTLYEALEALERDLHEHIHLENNILFPRAAEMEEKA